MRRFFRNNGLSLVLFALFFFSMLGQYFTGRLELNDDRQQHGRSAVGYVEYLSEGHFIEGVFENWESEFLQMGMYVVLTIFLFQKGSSESKTPDILSRVDVIPEDARQNPDAPYPVRRGGFLLKIYQNSLSLTLFLLFILSFILHAAGGVKVYNQEQAEHGAASGATLIQYLGTSRFWFESFQNWQSEFLSIGLMVVLSIFLRQKGSPESKPVDSPHDATGND
ncbi:MAG: DUF6766 family protein [Pyrinomonadaceae bacterium]